jgi:leader peptidase (prepilin peptidase) / N-methyltransferase
LWVDFNNPRAEDLITPLTFDWPFRATEFLAGTASLAVALSCFLVWCFALLPRRWRSRVSFAKAWRVMWRRIVARPEWRWVLPIALAGCAGIVFAWMRGGEAWRSLTSALIGLATGGGMIWIVRLMGAAVLKREAMGFGDVTLMAMIGAFLGWQAVLIGFFAAAVMGFVVGGIQWLLRRGNVIPYGPFLCLGAFVMILFWAPIWDKFGPYFEVPWLIPAVIALCLPPLPILLYGMKRLRERFFSDS